MPADEPPAPSPAPFAKYQLVRTRLVATLDLLAGLTTAERVAEQQGVPPDEVHRWQRGVIAAVAPETPNPAGHRTGDGLRLRETLHDLYEALETRSMDRDALLGVTTGFFDLDHLLGGFRPGTLHVLAGRPAMGRTALALAFAHGCAAAGHPVFYYSGETSEAQLVERLVGARAQVDNHRLRTGYFFEKDWSRLTAAVAELADLPLAIADDPTFTVADLRAEAQRIKEVQGGLGLVVVDPLELLRADPAAGPEAGAHRVAHGLKRLARELDTAVVAIAPLACAVDNRRDPRPTLADLRGESLSELADVVMLLYRDEYYDPDTRQRGSAEVIVARHRHGPIGHIELYFDVHSQRFAPISARRLLEP